jgi:hypothetical protein
MPPFIIRPKERSKDPNDYSGWNSTPWHPELTVLNLVVDPLKTEMISIKGHEYQSAQSSYQPHDLTYQSFCKTHVSYGNNVLSSITETNSRGLDAFKYECHTIVPKHIKNNRDTKARGVQELYRTSLLTTSGIQAKPACLPLDLA